MKKLWTLISMMLTLTLASAAFDAHAKRLGSGKTMGQTYKTAPAPATKPDAQTQQAAPAQNVAGQTAGKKGMLGGLMGGLLAGGLIAAMIGSGAFEGIQFMDILIIGLLAFVIFKLLRSRRPAATATPAPAYAGAPMGNPSPAPAAFTSASAATSGGFTQSEVPFNLPAGFDMTAFLAGAREHYRTLQDAWNKNDLAKIQEYVSPELYNELRAERAALTDEQHTEVMFIDAELVRADQIGNRAEVSIKFTGRYRDSVENVEEDIQDIWHLERNTAQPNAPWYIVGIES